MVSNSAEHLLAAFLLFIWRRGCPKILYSDRGGNLLSFLAYKVYQRLGVTKVSGSSHRHNVSGMCERTIQSVLTMLTCDMASEQHHTTWYQRVPPVLWSVNTSISASTGYSPFFLEHGRQPRDLASRAFDMADVPASSIAWVELMNQRLELARKIHSAVDTQAKVAQARRSALPKQARSEPPALLPGSFCYYQVQKFTRSANDGAKFVPRWSGPYVVRSKVPGSEHRYLISRSETSASFDAHITRLRASPHKTFGVVALESHASDGSGAGRGFHLLDPTIVFEIDRVLEVNEKEVLISFLGNEINSRWVTREVLSEQGLDDLVADFVDGGQSTLTSPVMRTGAKFTMTQTAVARLENKRTHDSFNRAYHVGKWLDNCPTCGQIGVKGNALLMCDFCPNAFHFGCLGMDLRARAPKGDWSCPTCRAADDLTRLDERPRKLQRRPRGSRPTEARTEMGPEPAATPPAAAAAEPRDDPQDHEVAAPRKTRGRPRGSRPTEARTEMGPEPAATPPAVAAAEQRDDPQDHEVAAPRRTRGRPRKVVAASEVELPMAPRDLSAQPEELGPGPGPDSDLELPHSRATRLGSAAHGVTLTPAAPTAARMLLVQEWRPAPAATPSYRHVCFTMSPSLSLPLPATGTHRDRGRRRVRWIDQR
jgi:hypothetical protein